MSRKSLHVGCPRGNALTIRAVEVINKGRLNYAVGRSKRTLGVKRFYFLALSEWKNVCMNIRPRGTLQEARTNAPLRVFFFYCSCKREIRSHFEQSVLRKYLMYRAKSEKKESSINMPGLFVAKIRHLRNTSQI